MIQLGPSASRVAPRPTARSAAASWSVDLQVEVELLRVLLPGHCGATWSGASWKATSWPSPARSVIQSDSCRTICQPVSSA